MAIVWTGGVEPALRLSSGDVWTSSARSTCSLRQALVVQLVLAAVIWLGVR